MVALLAPTKMSTDMHTKVDAFCDHRVPMKTPTIVLKSNLIAHMERSVGSDMVRSGFDPLAVNNAFACQ